MTRPIKHFGSSNFRNWIRRNAEVDSRDGYNLTDVDIVWENDLKEKWMVIEEKCKMATPKPKQVRLLRRIDTAGRRCSSFCGTHLVQFQNTSRTRPEDRENKAN